MLAFSVILRVVACSLPYAALILRMVYTQLVKEWPVRTKSRAKCVGARPSHLELDSQTVATFTYWGSLLQACSGAPSFEAIPFLGRAMLQGPGSCARFGPLSPLVRPCFRGLALQFKEGGAFKLGCFEAEITLNPAYSSFPLRGGSFVFVNFVVTSLVSGLAAASVIGGISRKLGTLDHIWDCRVPCKT